MVWFGVVGCECTDCRKSCRLPKGMYSVMRAMGSLTVQAPTRDTMLLWLPGWWCALKIRCGVVVRRLGVVKWLVW